MADVQSATMKLFKSSGTSANEFLKIIEEKPIQVDYNTKLVEIREDRVICERNGETVEYPCDTVLLAMGMVRNSEKVDELRRSVPETSARIVGDVREVGTICTAVNEAFQAALHM